MKLLVQAPSGKNKLILLVFYLYETEKERKDFEIRHAQLFEFPENDLKL